MYHPHLFRGVLVQPPKAFQKGLQPLQEELAEVGPKPINLSCLRRTSRPEKTL